MKRLYLYLTLVLLAVVVSCSKSNESDLNGTDGNNGGTNGGTSCDTTNMKFTANIKPILQNNCYACHSNANFAVSGVKLEDYADVKEHVDDGDLMGTITYAAGFPHMPQGAAKLSDCTINKIKAWVDRGALNN